MIRRPPISTLFPYTRSSDLAGAPRGAPIRELVTLLVATALVAWMSELLVGAVEERSEEHTSELQSQFHLVCRLLLEKKKNVILPTTYAFRNSAPPTSPLTIV